LTLSRKCHS